MAKLQDENHRLYAELEEISKVLPGPYYMDPPDGGDVSVLEQLRRMSVDASQYRTTIGLSMLIDGESPKVQEILKGIDAVPAEVARLQENVMRMRNAIEIIEHTLATLRGEK